LESLADISVEIFDDCANIPKTVDPAFSPSVRYQLPAPADGMYYLHVSNAALNGGRENTTYNVTVRVLATEPSPGALVLVAGLLKFPDAVQENIYHVTDNVYRTFQKNGYTDDRIFYLANELALNPDGNSNTVDVDLKPNLANLEKVLTQQILPLLGPDRALTLYLMDHGGQDKFYLNGRGHVLTPTDLDGWLDKVEEAIPGLRVNIIIEACHSGSFVEALKKPGRVILTSTAPATLAYASEQGAIFSDVLLNALGRGLSLYHSFEEASGTAQLAHRDQQPQLYDNANGQEAAKRGFAYVGTFPDEVNFPPYPVWGEVQFSGNRLTSVEGIIQAKVEDDNPNNPLSVWAVVYKPGYEPPKATDIEELYDEPLTWYTMRQNSSGIYQVKYEFDQNGTYEIVIYARDAEGALGRPRRVEVKIGSDSKPVYLPVLLK
jgi:hypothetical protein